MKKMKCANCGTDIEASFIFCPACGNNLAQTANHELIQNRQATVAEKTAWYYKTWFVSIILLLLFPVGVILMWTGQKFGLKTRIVLTIVFGGLFLSPFFFNNDENTRDSLAQNDSESAAKIKLDTDKAAAGQRGDKANGYDYSFSLHDGSTVKGIWANDVGTAIAQIKSQKTIETVLPVNVHAAGVYKIVYIIITNRQKDDITVDSAAYKLLDEQGKEYQTSFEGQMALQMQGEETFFFDKVNAGATTAGWLVFDVPQNVNIVKMEFSGGLTGKQVEVPFLVRQEEAADEAAGQVNEGKSEKILEKLPAGKDGKINDKEPERNRGKRQEDFGGMI